MFKNPRRGRQARNFTQNVPKILNLKSSSEQIFSENSRWVPLYIGETGRCMHQRSKEHDRDIQLSRTQTSAVSEHAVWS